jgi:hypothetical protein
VDGLLARWPELEALGVKVVLVGNGPPAALEAFGRELGLAERRVTLVTDPSLAAYRAAGLRRPRALGLRSAAQTLRALGAGYRQRRRAGDARQLGGAVLADETGRVLYHHRSDSAGDLADPSDIVQAALGHLVERRAAGRLV